MAKEILCFIEIDENQIKKSSLEVLSLAKKIKELEGADVISCALFSDDPDKYKNDLFAYGYEKIYSAKSDSFKNYRTQVFAKALVELAKNINPSYVLVPGTANGRDLAPYVGAKLKSGVIADVIDVEKADGGLNFVRPCFAGNLLYWGKFLNDGIKIASVRPKAFPVPEKIDGKQGEYVSLNYEAKEDDTSVRVLEVVKETGKISLQDADFIVAGGRGIGQPENFKYLNDLANVLGGAVGASRAVVDAGWISYDHQVGQTGKTVKPKIYLAFGISGAIQHLAGMRTSDIIVAVNKDPEAPIFKVATFGIVDDALNFIPKFTEEIKKRLVK